jgi:hypothetical protein
MNNPSHSKWFKIKKVKILFNSGYNFIQGLWFGYLITRMVPTLLFSKKIAKIYIFAIFNMFR